MLNIYNHSLDQMLIKEELEFWNKNSAPDMLLTATRFTKVKSYQLHHVGFKQVHVPPGSVLWSRKGASLRGVNLSTAAIHRTLWNSTLRGARLHRSFASGNI